MPRTSHNIRSMNSQVTTSQIPVSSYGKRTGPQCLFHYVKFILFFFWAMQLASYRTMFWNNIMRFFLNLQYFDPKL